MLRAVSFQLHFAFQLWPREPGAGVCRVFRARAPPRRPPFPLRSGHIANASEREEGRALLGTKHIIHPTAPSAGGMSHGQRSTPTTATVNQPSGRTIGGRPSPLGSDTRTQLPCLEDQGLSWRPSVSSHGSGACGLCTYPLCWLGPPGPAAPVAPDGLLSW